MATDSILDRLKSGKASWNILQKSVSKLFVVSHLKEKHYMSLV